MVFIKRLFKNAAFYRKECILGPLFKLFEASLELCVPLVMKSIIDVGIKNSNIPYIFRMAVILVLLGAAGLSCTIVAQYFSAKAAVGIVSKIKRELITKIQGLSYTELDCLGTSQLITSMTSDANQVQTGINLTLRLFMRSPFIVFGAMIMAFTVDAASALIFAVIIPLLSLAVFGIMLTCIPLYTRVQQNLNNILVLTKENLSGVRVIRAFCKETHEKEDFNTRCDTLTKSQNLVGKISALLNPITYIIINFGIIVLVYTGGLRVSKGFLSQGELVSLYNYMLLILVELIKLASLIITITKSVASEKRIENLLGASNLQASDSPALPDTDFKCNIEFKNVSFKYAKSAENALNKISFTAKCGSNIGIIGGTGSGKTSLVNLIPRFYEPTEGEIFMGGKNIKNIPLELLRSKIGVVPQKAILFSGTIKENIKWGNESATDEDIGEAIKISQSENIINAKENGLNEIIEQGGRNLSGGQRQRLCIARALVKKPDILILDDSSSALDLATDSKLRSAIKTLPFNPTVFIVSQRTSSIKDSDLIIVLEDGNAVGMGTHSELLRDCDIYREIHFSQFEKEDGR